MGAASPPTTPASAASLLFNRIGKLRGSWLLWFFVWYSSSSTAVTFLSSASAASAIALFSFARPATPFTWSRVSRMRVIASWVSVTLSRILTSRSYCLR